MKTVYTVQDMESLVKALKIDGKTIGFVPTMGYLHEGHLSLMREARSRTDVVVISIFVNPIQFGPTEDFDKYPRDFIRDELLARDAGVDIIFYPKTKDMYPEGFATYVDVERLTGRLCGAFRPGHFRGVTTVVAKLFGIVKPDSAYFGQKDAQQAIVIRRMVEDLNMGLDIVICPIVREKDGLAMSSRNTYLSEPERRDAVVLYQSLQKAEEFIRGGQRDTRKIVNAMQELISQKKSARIEYISIVDTKELNPLETLSGEALVALAVYIGKARLIDNIITNA